MRKIPVREDISLGAFKLIDNRSCRYKASAHGHLRVNRTELALTPHDQAVRSETNHGSRRHRIRWNDDLDI